MDVSTLKENTMSNKLTDSDMGRIGLTILVRMIAKNDKYFAEMTNQETVRRNLPNLARELGENLEDIRGFYDEILPRVIGRRTGHQQVSLRRLVKSRRK